MGNRFFYTYSGPHHLSYIISCLDIPNAEQKVSDYTNQLSLNDSVDESVDDLDSLEAQLNFAGEITAAILNPCKGKDLSPVIFGVRDLQQAEKGDLTFFHNKKYLIDLKKTKATACFVPLDFAEKITSDIILLPVQNPYYCYALALDLFFAPKERLPRIMPTAHIEPSAVIGKGSYIGHNVIIEEEAEIGNNAVIESGTNIGYKVKIGNNARIGTNVSISHSIIGDNVVILPGACIGQEGFGFATENGRHKKIYHIGAVIIGNNVEIGANTTIDRGSMNNTIIEDSCMIDNLVQIGHNCLIRQGTVIVAQAGIAGSSKIGAYCALGGQAGIAGHLNVADRVRIAAQGGVIQDIDKAGAVMGGTPAVPINDWHRQSILMKKLISK